MHYRMTSQVHLELPQASFVWVGCVLGVFFMLQLGYSQPMEKLPRPLKVAHRGGAGLAPENTLAAFRNALKLGVDAVELDVHLSKDGVPVVIHDADLLRATGTVGEVSTLTLPVLRQLNAAATYTGQDVGPQPIPTLDEVLALVQGRAGGQIEIKVRADNTRYPGIEAQVIQAVQRYDMLADVVVISFDLATLQTIHTLEPGLPTCALFSSTYLKRFDARRNPTLVVTDLLAHGFRCVGVKHTWLAPALYQALRAEGFRVGVWTVNDPYSIRKFAEMGVDFMTSDRPDFLQQLIP